MAQHEQDREDIMREATALTTRAELSTGGLEENVIVGFRTGGAASVFIGADPVYQFNTAGELRRGFRDGQLIKAVDGKLFTMRRQRRDGQVQLLRSELSEEETNTYLANCSEHLDALQKSLDSDEFELIRQVPDDADVVSIIIAWVAATPRPIRPAARPNVA